MIQYTYYKGAMIMNTNTLLDNKLLVVSSLLSAPRQDIKIMSMILELANKA